MSIIRNGYQNFKYIILFIQDYHEMQNVILFGIFKWNALYINVLLFLITHTVSYQIWKCKMHQTHFSKNKCYHTIVSKQCVTVLSNISVVDDDFDQNNMEHSTLFTIAFMYETPSEHHTSIRCVGDTKYSKKF